MTIRNLPDWEDVSRALDNIRERRSYYIGGTLCIDMNEGYSICLNCSGEGFAFVLGDKEEYEFTAPEAITRKVNEIYKEIKA